MDKAPKSCPKESIQSLRDSAKELFRREDYKGASELYTQILERDELDRGLRSMILSNRAQCSLLIGAYSECVKDASDSLALVQTDKALFRRAQANIKLGRLDEAEKDLLAFRALTDQSDTGTREKIDGMIGNLNREREVSRTKAQEKARRIVCTERPKWAVDTQESEFHHIPVNTITKAVERTQLNYRVDMKLPQTKYVPRSMRSRVM